MHAPSRSAGSPNIHRASARCRRASLICRTTISSAGRVLTRDQIMEAERGRELEAFDRSIDVHMGRIRAAIELDAKNPRRILTVRGVGYVFAKQQD